MQPWERRHRRQLGRSRSSQRGQAQSSRSKGRKWRTQAAERHAQLRADELLLDEADREAERIVVASLEWGYKLPAYDPFAAQLERPLEPLEPRLLEAGQQRYELELRRRKRRLGIYVKGLLCCAAAIVALWLVVESVPQSTCHGDCLQHQREAE